MFSVKYVYELWSLIESLPLSLKLISVLCTFFLAPAFGVPIMLIVSMTVMLLGLIQGGICAAIGFFLAALLYFKLAKKIAKISFIQRQVDRIKNRIPLLKKKRSIAEVVSLALLVPFLPLITILGMTQKKTIKICGSLFAGSFPAFVIAVQAGYIGKETLGKNSITSVQIYLSIGILLVALLIQFFLYKRARKVSNV